MEMVSTYETDFQANNTLDLITMSVEHKNTNKQTNIYICVCMYVYVYIFMFIFSST